MAVSKVEATELTNLLKKLRCVVDGYKDLPSNIFIDSERMFWFFERPLLSFIEVSSRFISKSLSDLQSDVFIKFSGMKDAVGSCFCINGDNIENDVLQINGEFDSFFSGTVGYPVILFNEGLDWVAFESANEEFGVVAVKASAFQTDFSGVLEVDFISLEEFGLLSLSESTEGVIARAFVSSYGNR